MPINITWQDEGDQRSSPGEVNTNISPGRGYVVPWSPAMIDGDDDSFDDLEEPRPTTGHVPFGDLHTDPFTTGKL